MKDKLLKDWKIIGRFTDGEFSVVYKVVRDDGVVCAIKEICLPRSNDDVELLIKNNVVSSPEEAMNYFMKSIQNEVIILKKFNGSPNFLQIYDFTQSKSENNLASTFYIRMEYAENIKTYFKNNGVSEEDVLKLGIDICSALESLSKYNVTHNDIKPGNIFIDSSGNYKLGDFGNAKNLGEKNVVVFGTPNYISPEIYNKTGTLFSSDLYSLGLVMYKLLSGELPFIDENTTESKALKKRLDGNNIPIINGVTKELMNIILKACSFDSNERYSNATLMKKELLALKNLNKKKRSINFISSNFDNTISIYDNDLLNSQKYNVNINYGKNKAIHKVEKKELLKKIIMGVVLLVLLLSGVQFYRLNRSCGEGKINQFGKCVKGYYYCDTDYVLKNDKCQKTIESVDAKVTYTCKSGYTLNGDMCINNDVREPKPTLKCAVDGYTLNTNTNKCEMTISGDASPQLNCSGNDCLIDSIKTYSCSDSSYKLNGTKCSKESKTTTPAQAVYSCGDDGTLSGNICNYVKDAETSSGVGWWWGSTPTCSKGQYNYYDKKCHYSESAIVTYKCNNGTYDGGTNCIISNSSIVDAKVTYSCNKGYTLVLDSNMCAKTTNVTKYVCPDNAVLRGSKCYTTTTMDAVNFFECDDGFVLAGTSCIKNEEVKAVKKYTCSKVYTLNGDKCEKYSIKNAKAHYDK